MAIIPARILENVPYPIRLRKVLKSWAFKLKLWGHIERWCLSGGKKAKADTVKSVIENVKAFAGGAVS